MRRTKFYIRQYILCGMLALAINLITPGLLDVYGIRISDLFGLAIWLVSYPMLILVWKLWVVEKNESDGASWWWFVVGYFVSFAPFFLIGLCVFLSYKSGNF